MLDNNNMQKCLYNYLVACKKKLYENWLTIGWLEDINLIMCWY